MRMQISASQRKKYMKVKISAVVIAILMCVAVLVSCEVSTNLAKTDPANLGTIRISLPRINPYIAASQSKSVGAKAFAYVDSVVLDFYVNASDATPIFELSLGAADYDPVTNTISGELSVPANTYGRVIVSVLNTDNPTGEQLVTAGQTEESLTINAGATTNLTITLYPSNPVALTSEYSELASINQYGEKWYSFVAPREGAVVQTQTETGNINAYIFGPDGLPAEIGIVQKTNKITIYSPNTIEGAKYYVCLIAPDGDSTGQVRFVNNGTLNVILQ
jgi:hypothetical protein